MMRKFAGARVRVAVSRERGARTWLESCGRHDRDARGRALDAHTHAGAPVRRAVPSDEPRRAVPSGEPRKSLEPHKLAITLAAAFAERAHGHHAQLPARQRFPAEWARPGAVVRGAADDRIVRVARPPHLLRRIARNNCVTSFKQSLSEPVSKHGTAVADERHALGRQPSCRDTGRAPRPTRHHALRLRHVSAAQSPRGEDHWSAPASRAHTPQPATRSLRPLAPCRRRRDSSRKTAVRTRGASQRCSPRPLASCGGSRRRGQRRSGRPLPAQTLSAANGRSSGRRGRVNGSTAIAGERRRPMARATTAADGAPWVRATCSEG